MNSGDSSVTVCVPVGPNHVHLIPRLLRNLSMGDRLPERVLIAPSAPTLNSGNLRIQGLSVQTLDVMPGATASANRNRAWDLADTSHVTFCDVDDWYAPWRLRLVLDAMTRHSADLAYHAYRYLWPETLMRAPRRTPPIAVPDELAALNQGISTDVQNTRMGRNNPVFPTIAGTSAAVLGHVTVKRNLELRFPKLNHGEDGWFAAEALRMRRRVVYVAAPLSIYDPLSLSNLRMAAASRTKHYFSRKRLRKIGLEYQQ